MAQDYVGMWYGFLSMFAGIMGVMLVIRGAALEPKSDFIFALGLLVFGVAFVFRVLNLIYASKTPGLDED